jgi:CDP-glucose 4,6-dehydratase
MVTPEFLGLYSGKRVMITGHTGFKGSWLAFLLNQIGADVLGYALPPLDKNNHFDMLGLSSLIEHVEADVRDDQKIMATMKEFQPEIVFHLAAQALVRPSYDEPRTTFETNVMGSINLLEAVRATGSVRSLVFITSDKCYENVEWIWGYRENDVVGGRDPYSASKGATEIVFSSYERSFFHTRANLGTASARAGNVIGGGDWAVDRIIPDCIRAIQSNKAIDIRSPHATRPWQHVLEPLSGYLLLGNRLYENPKKYYGAWNFGPPSSQARTVLDVAEHIVSRYGSGSIVTDKNSPKHHEASLLQLNCDKANQYLGWYPRWEVEKTLNMTSDWYQHVDDGVGAKEVTEQQLREYFPEISDLIYPC